MTTAEIITKNLFGNTDPTDPQNCRELKIGPFAADSTAITNLKDNIIALNAYPGNMHWLGENGERFTKIYAAEIVTTTKTVIFDKYKGSE